MFTRNEIRNAFDEWLRRCEGKNWPEANDPDVLADYLVELIEEARTQPEPV